MDILLKGFIKEFETKHGAIDQKAKEAAEAENAASGLKPLSEPLKNDVRNASKIKTSKKNNNNKADTMFSQSFSLDCGCKALYNKENCSKPSTSGASKPLSKSQVKKLKRKQKMLAKKDKCADDEVIHLDKDLPTTSKKAEQNPNPKQNNGAIPKVKPGNNEKNTQDINKATGYTQNEIKAEQPEQKNLQNNKVNSNKQAKTKNNIANMSTNPKDKENKSENKDTAQNSTKSNKQASKNKKTNKTAFPRKKDEPELKEAKAPVPTGTTKALVTKQPRHSALLKPLIFDVRNEELLLWARDFQNLIVESMGCTKQTMPFYEIGRHFGMRATVTDNEKVMDMFKNFLRERKAGFFSYTPKEKLRTLLVLKKPRALTKCNASMVESALHEMEVPVVHVEVFKAMWKPELSYHRFLVEVNRGVDLQQLFKKTTILNTEKWHWSKLKKKSISQCRNCQRYGHVASNCLMPYRCVKCKDEHEVGKCPRSKQKDGVKEVYCHNCKKTGHPSNYRGCLAYKERCQALERQRAYSRFSAAIKRVVFSVNKALEKDKSK